MKRVVQLLLNKLGWQLIRQRDNPPVNPVLPACGLNSFFPVLKRIGFDPRHIIDVGANHGYWTRAALQFFPQACFTLVEPQDNLRTNIEDLIEQGYKLQWINAGAGDKPGTLMFTVAPRDDSSSFVPTSQAALATGRPQVPVAVRTLNEIVASSSAPAPEMVKIDAEGFDLKVLAGASNLFGKTEVFLVEAAVCAPRLENSMLEVIKRMAEAGYKPMDITDLNRSPKHGVLWLCELAFIRNDSPLLNSLDAYE